ncbi:amino acid adenylation domain-containing protein [Pigmentiphaga litoralis]|uniref:amino acid adenylation domain-containing protein n=1 Tax=Pigmentiphaga litoralis TaxID=516702 RepID=UPI003B436024
MSELGTLYSAGASADASLLLPEALLQYADYAAWEQAGGSTQHHAEHLAYWREALAVEPGECHPVLALAADRPRAPNTKYVGGRCHLSIEAPLLSRLRALATHHDATLPMVLLSAFQALLYRYTGQRDIRVGVPVANRTQPQVDNVVGLFVNTLVMRHLFDGTEPLEHVLATTRRAMVDAQRHQSLPLEALVEVLNPERSASHSPLFQVLFNYLQDDRLALEQWRNVEVERCELTPSDAQFDLALDIHERVHGAITVTFVYAANLFDPATIERMSRHFLMLLTAFVDEPQRYVGDVNILEPAEQQALHIWSEEPAIYPEQEPIHRLIERQARDTPDSIAVVFADQALTYAELNRRANRLAHYLIGHGVRIDALVGICMQRSSELIVAMLAVLKAGAAYVPLEPEYPAGRIAAMLQESGVLLSLTHDATHATVVSHDALPFINVDALDLNAFPASDADVAVHSENLAYVIYTSGSTGRPKGAANRHGALLNRLAWMQDAYAMTSADAVLQKTPFSFDVSVWEFFWPLMTGARLVLAQPGEHRDPERLRRLIRTHGITTLHFVPSMLAAFLSSDVAQSCDSVRRIICSGEALSAELRNDVLHTLPHVELVNLYGPTEAAIDVTHWTCHDDGALRVPIGFPIGNVIVRVLDERLNHVPIGVPGELYLGGVALARGYAGRPSLSAERFVADVAASDGARLYRTGDRVCWNAEGHLEYLGRLDHQVKIRGFRVELAEIEAQLIAQPDVRDAAVVVKEGPSGQQLTGYLCARQGAVIDVAQVRERLGLSLPDYMIPAALVVMTELPVSANGKLDRSALPAPVYVSAHAYTAPQGRTEQIITDIWATALGLARVGVEDNFFELGGHSLLLVRVHAALEDALHPGLSVIDLFKYPTIRALARRIEQGQSNAAVRHAADPRGGPSASRRATLLTRNRSNARNRS